ncbi:hypothetical protein mRhiFer1_010174 [Rhinolophus ferrumequinum]|uniref:Uncharacterized protein n=1 Tax=Rhinolophus ferrumequinum TaxID=59479 RepID=A0A7J7XQ54_RHIFE|nr:hypothetical protein mRhiFer1_010174 [Rhinolophus ferrumequinum]
MPCSRLPLGRPKGFCVVINKTCCTYINNSGQVETSIKKVYERAEWLHKYNSQGATSSLTSWLPSPSWLLPLIGPFITLVLLLLFGRFLFHLLINFIQKTIAEVTGRPIALTMLLQEHCYSPLTQNSN